MALRDPILETAARIVAEYTPRPPYDAHLHLCRSWAADHRPRAEKLVATAVKYIDTLRAIGALAAPLPAWRQMVDAPRDRKIIILRASGHQVVAVWCPGTGWVYAAQDRQGDVGPIAFDVTDPAAWHECLALPTWLQGPIASTPL
ncbi:hypothetical protein [Acidocella sp.]|uniref:hypothetical protein n=1 Tax=Acidocella sp. TaxID=50710 RepID=UPI00262DB873|nr:hypothetical protein [Acidocella sp.]